jgi:predicted secreted protein
MQRYGHDVKHIHARQGESFTVALPSLPGAGYSWRVDVPANLIRLVSHSVQPASDAIGAAALDEFVFYPVSEGSTTLDF